MKVLSILAKNSWKRRLNFSRSALFHMETRVSLKYFANGCSFSISNFGELMGIYGPSCSSALPWNFFDPTVASISSLHSKKYLQNQDISWGRCLTGVVRLKSHSIWIKQVYLRTSLSLLALVSVYVGQGSTIQFVRSWISFLDSLLLSGQLFGWMESINVAGVLQEAGDGDSRAHTRYQV